MKSYIYHQIEEIRDEISNDWESHPIDYTYKKTIQRPSDYNENNFSTFFGYALKIFNTKISKSDYWKGKGIKVTVTFIPDSVDIYYWYLTITWHIDSEHENNYIGKNALLEDFPHGLIPDYHMNPFLL